MAEADSGAPCSRSVCLVEEVDEFFKIYFVVGFGAGNLYHRCGGALAGEAHLLWISSSETVSPSRENTHLRSPALMKPFLQRSQRPASTYFSRSNMEKANTR